MSILDKLMSLLGPSEANAFTPEQFQQALKIAAANEPEYQKRMMQKLGQLDPKLYAALALMARKAPEEGASGGPTFFGQSTPGERKDLGGPGRYKAYGTQQAGPQHILMMSPPLTKKQKQKYGEQPADKDEDVIDFLKGILSQ